MEKDDKIFLAYSGQMGEELEKKTKERIQWIIEMAGKEKNILDIGCSQGIISILVAEQGNKVLGIDINEENIEFAKNLLKESYTSSLEKVTFLGKDFFEWESKEKYDVILITEVLEHLENASVFLKKVSENLSEDGKIIITVPFGVLNHPDHRSTFYLKGIYDLVAPYFDIGELDFVGSCIGVVAYTKGSLDGKILLDESVMQREEAKFFEVDKYQTDKIEELYTKAREAADKYKVSLKNYETAKQWHQTALDKNANLEKELKETKIVCTEAKSLLAVKEEECRLGAEKDKYQNEIIEGLKTLGNQRDSLISEYMMWSERNKNRIEELERNAEEQKQLFYDEREKQERERLVQKKEFEELIEYQKIMLGEQKAERELLQESLQKEQEQRNVYASELREYVSELDVVQKRLEQKEADCRAIEEQLQKKEADCKATEDLLKQKERILNSTEECLKQKAAELEDSRKLFTYEKSQKEKCLAELERCLEELEVQKQVLEELKICQSELNELQAKLELENINQSKMKNEFFACEAVLKEQEAFLSELRQYIRKLETQNRYLASENAECKRKLSIITDTKIGQFSLKVYHLLKRIYRKVFKK